jgi:hypothetical protein
MCWRAERRRKKQSIEVWVFTMNRRHKNVKRGYRFGQFVKWGVQDQFEKQFYVRFEEFEK